MSAFASHAMRLLRQGYSPVPIRAGAKRPVMDDWHGLRKKPMTELEIARMARNSPWLGLGVAGGYRGCVPVDIDTDDRAILDIVGMVLPRPNVAKHGRRGLTAFYRTTTPIKGRKLKTPKPEESMLVEILTTGQTVIPPTMHPDIGRPYRWLTPRTLFDTPIEQLVEVTPNMMADLEEALGPWLARPRVYTPQPSGDSVRVSASRMQRVARGSLRRVAHELASKPKDSGRNWALFAAAATVGKFLHHNLLSLAEIERALLGACESNGLIKEDGLRQCKASLASGLDKARNDQLPVLGVYERRA